jgi:hypothetical protein
MWTGIVEFVLDFGAWLVAIANHYSALVTGGFIIAVTSHIERKWPAKFAKWRIWRYSVWGFFLFALFQAWQDEYRSKLGRDAEVKAVNTRCSAIQRELQSAEEKGRSFATTVVTKTDRLEHCQEQLIDAEMPRPLQMQNWTFEATALALASARADFSSEPNQRTVSGIAIAVHNQPLAANFVELSCSAPFTLLHAVLGSSGGGFMGLDVKSLAKATTGRMKITLQLIPVTWAPNVPLILTLSADGSLPSCKIAAR